MTKCIGEDDFESNLIASRLEKSNILCNILCFVIS